MAIKINDKVKFKEWHYGTLVAVKDGMAEIQTQTGIRVIKPIGEVVRDKQLPLYLDEWKGIIRFRYKGRTLGYYHDIDEAIKARDKYFDEKEN